MLLQGRDHLRLLLQRHDGSAAAWEAEPPTTGFAGLDTLLAALTHHEFELANSEAPAWSCAQPLPRPWIPEHPFLDRDTAIAQTPNFLRRLNIFVPARDLVTA